MTQPLLEFAVTLSLYHEFLLALCRAITCHSFPPCHTRCSYSNLLIQCPGLILHYPLNLLIHQSADLCRGIMLPEWIPMWCIPCILIHWWFFLQLIDFMYIVVYATLIKPAPFFSHLILFCHLSFLISILFLRTADTCLWIHDSVMSSDSYLDHFISRAY